MWTKLLIGIVILVGGAWFVRYLMTPAPGQTVPDLGREHVSADVVAKTKYNSNPPTSGPHLGIWVKPGIYDTPQQEGELIHSLEHGYVIMSYNCNAGKAASPEASPSAVNSSDTCKTLVKNLSDLAAKKKLFKLIVVPRSQLDTIIALTAWGVIDKFDPPAGGFDAKRIERFIDYHRDHGPEKTME